MRSPVDKHERPDWTTVGEDLNRRRLVESRISACLKRLLRIIEGICLGGVAQIGAVGDDVRATR